MGGMQRKVPNIFFNRECTEVARELVGKFLVREVAGEELAYMITEVEAYAGPEDLASHARFGETRRNAAMFGSPGTIYVYFTYGMHFMLNISCRERGYPSAVLIRGVEGIVGPGRLTKALAIDKNMNGKPLGKISGLWIEDRGVELSPRQILKTPRVGIDYAGVWVKKPWRFILKK
jgi:DNA-3-methyladenine glycosylase